MVVATPTSPAVMVLENRTGRPSEFTPEKRTAILEAIKLGLPEGRAAELSGLDPSTLAHWKSRGRREEAGPYFDFLIELKEADAHCEHALLGIVRKAAENPKHWSAALSLMERKWPKRWSRTDRGSGVTTEEIIQNTLIRQRATDLLRGFRDEQARIQKELDLIGRQIPNFLDPAPLLLRKKNLEKEIERIEEGLEWYRMDFIHT